MKAKAVLLALFLAAAPLCSAQLPTPTATIAATPTPTVTVTPTPSSSSMGTPYNFPGTPSPTITPIAPLPVAIDSHFQPAANPQAGTMIEWRVFQPTDGAGKWPVVIILHIGGFRGGDYYDGMNNAAEDLRDAGFYTVVASYELAPKNLINGQRDHTDPMSGRPPEQTDDVKAVVGAARADLHCLNRLVGVLGGSAGASHAAFVALDTTPTGVLTWPFWSRDARPNFVACLSGQYDLTELVTDDDDVSGTFAKDSQNYTNTTVPSLLWGASPVSKASSDIIPMYFIRAENDPGSPRLQQYYMWNALTRAGASSSLFRMWNIPDSGNHAFGYWNDRIKDAVPINTQNIDLRVKERVIGFFKQYLK